MILRVFRGQIVITYREVVYRVLENGDHDSNDIVDGLDLLKWQRGESAKPLSSFDLAAWELNYGETLVSPAIAAATIPEPATDLLALAALCLALSRRRAR